jgi:PAS domain S-box-containing protein
MATAVSRAVIEVLLDRVNQGAVTLSSEGQIVYANQRFASMLGMTRSQLIGRPFTDLVAAADRESLAAALTAGRDTASQCLITLPRTNGGGELQALVTFAPLGHGQASGLVTDLGDMLGSLRNAMELLKRKPASDGQRPPDAIERHTGRILELMEDLRRLNPRE